MPQIEKLRREVKDRRLESFVVNFREDTPTVKNFFDQPGVTFTVLLDYDGNVLNEYGASTLPLSYFFDRKGIFIGKVAGDRKRDNAEAKAFVRELLQQKNDRRDRWLSRNRVEVGASGAMEGLPCR